MDNLEALKAIYTALGGSSAIPAGATNADVLALIATQCSAVVAKTLPAVGSAGQVLTTKSGAWKAADIPSQLPAVTQANAGEVLTVNAEGKWAAAALPST